MILYRLLEIKKPITREDLLDALVYDFPILRKSEELRRMVPIDIIMTASEVEGFLEEHPGKTFKVTTLMDESEWVGRDAPFKFLRAHKEFLERLSKNEN